MADLVKPTPTALAEALVLSEDILKNLELGEVPLSSVALKTSRLARLLNDFEFQRIMEHEVGGYPGGPDGMLPEVYQRAVQAGREFAQEEGSGAAKK